MARKNPHIGSRLESRLDEAGIRGDVTAAATKTVIARQLASEIPRPPHLGLPLINIVHTPAAFAG